MAVPLTVFRNVEELGRATARIIADGIEVAAHAGHRYLLGCPTGRSPQSTYRHLARETADRRLDLTRVIFVLMDEYLDQASDGALLPVDSSTAHSCVGFGRRELLAPLRLVAGDGRAPQEENLWSPDPRDPQHYDSRIRDAGGIDLFLLATGASDGHIALNPAGSPADSGSRIVELARSTREDNVASFPDFATVDDVPTHGVTVGIATIRDLSRSVLMLASGEDKRRSVARLVDAERYSPDWPATILAECRDARLFVDSAAAPLPASVGP